MLYPFIRSTVFCRAASNSYRRSGMPGLAARTPLFQLLFDYVYSKKWLELGGRAQRVEIDIAICELNLTMKNHNYEK